MSEKMTMAVLRVLLARSRGTPLAFSHSDPIMGSKTITGHVLGVRGRPDYGVLLLFGSQAGSQHTLERAGPRIPVIAKLILQWVLPTPDLRGGALSRKLRADYSGSYPLSTLGGASHSRITS